MANQNIASPGRGRSLYDLAIINLKTTYNLQPDQLEKLLRVSITSLEESFAVATRALEDDNLGELQSVAHKIKGTLLGVGLNGQADMAREIEEDLRLEKRLDYRSLFAELQSDIQSLLSV